MMVYSQKYREHLVTQQLLKQSEKKDCRHATTALNPNEKVIIFGRSTRKYPEESAQLSKHSVPGCDTPSPFLGERKLKTFSIDLCHFKRSVGYSNRVVPLSDLTPTFELA